MCEKKRTHWVGGYDAWACVSVCVFATVKNHMARIRDDYVSISLSFCNILCCLREIWNACVREGEWAFLVIYTISNLFMDVNHKDSRFGPMFTFVFATYTHIQYSVVFSIDILSKYTIYSILLSYTIWNRVTHIHTQQTRSHTHIYINYCHNGIAVFHVW